MWTCTHVQLLCILFIWWTYCTVAPYKPGAETYDRKSYAPPSQLASVSFEETCLRDHWLPSPLSVPVCRVVPSTDHPVPTESEIKPGAHAPLSLLSLLIKEIWIIPDTGVIGKWQFLRGNSMKEKLHFLNLRSAGLWYVDGRRWGLNCFLLLQFIFSFFIHISLSDSRGFHSFRSRQRRLSLYPRIISALCSNISV